ncbi:phosphotransferase enzyme family protein [Roseobacter sp. S98]|uniref:phosphotransferase enzyme family protein n=1 Tax=Roseobacter algicola (ex Choi et al. 2025) (nom. illeg.) TaxID=3092138 RepID=UPI0035C7334A
MIPDLPLARWGLSGSISEVESGNRNRVFRLITADGTSFALKSTQHSEASLAWLGALHAAARGAGLLVPGYMTARDGALNCHGWTCEPWVEGKGFEAGDLVAVRDRVRQFHRLSDSVPRRPGVAGAADIVHGNAPGTVFPDDMPPDVVERCLLSWQAVSGNPVGVVHGDINAGNLIWSDGGVPVLIDWDEARRDYLFFDDIQVTPPTGGKNPEQLRAALAWEVFASWHAEPERARQLADDLLNGG